MSQDTEAEPRPWTPDTPDPEIQACVALIEALGPLDGKARERVLGWAADRFLAAGRSPHESAMAYLDLMAKALDAIAQHKRANKQPSEADKKLYALGG